MKVLPAAALTLSAIVFMGCGTKDALFEPRESPAGAGSASSAGSGGAAAGGPAVGTAAAAGAGAPAALGGQAGASAGSSTGGGGGSGGAIFVPPTPVDCQPWPTPGETVELDATLSVSGVFDGGMKRYIGVGALAGDGQDEDMPAIMRLADGTVLKNVVLGKPASDGVHCDGTCYLQNVWWEDVGEDAATLDGTDPKQSLTIECAGARHAADKVFQHNGPGTYVLANVYIEDFNKLYRSCGNCLTQYQRHVLLRDVHAEDGELLVGINQNYGDTADFTNIEVSSGIDICSLYEANDTGAEPHVVDSGSDPEHCRYESSDIHRP
jgi:pectate lyase